MPSWLNEEKLVCLAAVLLLCGMVYNAQNNWLALSDEASGSTSLDGASRRQAVDDSFAVDFVSADFAAFSLPDSRNVFEPLDKMLPMPPVLLTLPSLPEPQVLAPLPVPAPPSTGHAVCRLSSERWTASGAGGSAFEEPGAEDPEPAGEELAEDLADDLAEEGDPGASLPDDEEEDEPAPAPPAAGWDDPRVRPHDMLVFKESGSERKGFLIREFTDTIVFEDASDPPTRHTWQRKDIAKIIPRKSLAEVLAEDFAAVRKTDDKAYVKLFERCLAETAPPEARQLAEEWAIRVCEDGKRSLELYQLVARHFRSRYDLEHEMQVYDSARRIIGEFLPIELVRGQADLYIRLGLAERARELVQENLQRRRGDEGLLALLAQYHFDAGQYEETIALLRRLGASSLGRSEIATLLGGAEYRAGLFEDARGHLQVVAANPDTAPAEVLVLLGACDFVLGDTAQASVHFATVLSRAEVTGQHRAAAAYNLGLIALLDQDIRTAQERFDEAGMVDPTNPWPNLGRGFIAEMTGDQETAEAEMNAGLKVLPRLGYAHLGLGRLGERAGAAPEDVRTDYQLAFVEDFELTDAVARLGYTAARAGDAGQGHENYFEALDYLSEASRRLPDETLLQLRIAHCYIALGDLDRAAEILERVWREHPDDLDALAGLAYVTNSQGDELRARSHLDYLSKRTGARGELADFAKTGLEAIDRNLSRWRWIDRFSRSGDTPRREWTTLQEVGVQVILDPASDLSEDSGDEGAGVLFSGSQASDAPEAPTRLEREIDPKTFVSFKATVDTGKAANAMVCVSVRQDETKAPTEIVWGRNLAGKLAYRVTTRGRADEWQVISDYPSGDRHDLEIQMVTARGKQRYFVLLIDGVVIRDEEERIRASQLTSSGSRKVRVGVSAAAAAFEEYSVIVDDVELVEGRPAKK